MPAGNRHLQYVVRAHALQWASSYYCRAREARRLRSRRLSTGISGDVTRRGAYAADNDAVSQSRIDGR